MSTLLYGSGIIKGVREKTRTAELLKTGGELKVYGTNGGCLSCILVSPLCSCCLQRWIMFIFPADPVSIDYFRLTIDYCFLSYAEEQIVPFHGDLAIDYFLLTIDYYSASSAFSAVKIAV